MATEITPSNLSIAFDEKTALKLGLTLEQSMALNSIMCKLATAEFEKGLKKGRDIFRR
jgi:hypothetical protein